MNQNERMKAIAEKNGVQAGLVKKIVDSFVESVVEEVAEEGSCTIFEFGRFDRRKVARRPYRDIRSGRNMMAQARWKMHFKPSNSLRKRFKEMPV